MAKKNLKIFLQKAWIPSEANPKPSNKLQITFSCQAFLVHLKDLFVLRMKIIGRDAMLGSILSLSVFCKPVRSVFLCFEVSEAVCRKLESIELFDVNIIDASASLCLINSFNFSKFTSLIFLFCFQLCSCGTHDKRIF